MEKALRRQAGADTIEIDTEAGTASISYAEPRTIDFASVERAAYDAGYTLTGLVLEVEGHLEEVDCATCGSTVTVLRARGTDQQWELAGVPKPAAGEPALALGEPVVLEALLEDWSGPHLRLEPIEVRRAP